jgi:hypothetical protein
MPVAAEGLSHLAAHVAAFVVGAACVLATLGSAIRTVMVPRAEQALLARWVFAALRRPFDLRARRARSWEEADRVMARYGPITLITLPGAWVALVILGFAPIYWAVGVSGPRDALIISGSSLLTLGFAYESHGPALVATFVEATVGLGLVALLISFLPTIYQAFSHREVLVSQLDARAGTPPTPLALFRRAARIDWQADDLWDQWDTWFAELEESHSSFLALPYFRSPHHGRSWVTAAGAVLDAAALRASTLDMERSWRAELCIRSGFLALRRVAGSHGIVYDADPAPTDPISIERHEWDAVVDDLVAAGVAVKADRDQAWRDFAGWRVNYDVPLVALCGELMAPYAPWSSDRSLAREVHTRRSGHRRYARRTGRLGDLRARRVP